MGNTDGKRVGNGEGGNKGEREEITVTAKEARFAQVYLETMDLKTAAEAIGAAPGAELLEKYEKGIRAYREAVSASIRREDIIRRLVRLGFSGGSECLGILLGTAEEGTDLSLVSELKRGSNGTLEVKLIDRVAVLRLLLEVLGGTESDGAEEFLRALRDGEDA